MSTGAIVDSAAACVKSVYFPRAILPLADRALQPVAVPADDRRVPADDVRVLSGAAGHADAAVPVRGRCCRLLFTIGVALRPRGAARRIYRDVRHLTEIALHGALLDDADRLRDGQQSRPSQARLVISLSPMTPVRHGVPRLFYYQRLARRLDDGRGGALRDGRRRSSARRCSSRCEERFAEQF